MNTLQKAFPAHLQHNKSCGKGDGQDLAHVQEPDGGPSMGGPGEEPSGAQDPKKWVEAA